MVATYICTYYAIEISISAILRSGSLSHVQIKEIKPVNACT